MNEPQKIEHVPPDPWRRHEHGEISFEAPPDWREVTEVRLAPHADPRDVPPSLLVSCFTVARGETVDRFASAALAKLSQSIPELEVVDSIEIAIRGVRALETRVRWTTEGQTYVQRLVVLAHGPAMYALTGTGPAHQAEALDRAFDHAVATLWMTTPGEK